MGIYDTNREGATQITYTGSDAAAGVGFKKAAEKFLEVLQGQVDQGFNEGFDTMKEIPLSPHTTMRARVQQAGFEPLAVVEIETNLPPAPVGEPTAEILETLRCPLLPLSRPGRRMFSHLFGHDTDGDGDFLPKFKQRDVPEVQTPYIIPSLDQGAYCSTDFEFPGNGLALKHGEINLTEPFPFLGRLVKTAYIHVGYIGFQAPNVRLGFDNNIQARNAPCTIDPIPFPIFVPDIEDFNTGGSFAISAGPGDFGGACAGINFNKVRLIEGSALFGADEVGRAEAEKEVIGVSASVGVIGKGDLRKFAIFNFNENLAPLGPPSPNIAKRNEYEVVLLYPSKLCPGAIGFFYGGLDGVRPWAYREWENCPVIVQPPCIDHWLGPQACTLSPPGTAGSNFVVPSDGGYLIGGDRQGVAWIQGDETTALSNPGANVNLNSRSFWIELDGQGFPSGRGLHNSSPELETGIIGSGDLFFVRAEAAPL